MVVISRLLSHRFLHPSSRLLICRISVPRTGSSLDCSPRCVVVESRRFLRTRSTQSPSGFGSQNEEPPKEPPPPPGDNGSGKPPMKIDPRILKKLQLFAVFITVSTFVISFMLIGSVLSTATISDQNILDALADAPIDFDHFLKHFLAAGEVVKVTYIPEQQLAVAILQPGAVINGIPFNKPAVAVKFNREGSQPDQFRLEIRHFEETMGIPLKDAVPINYHHGLTGVKLVELFVGFLILGWLGAQYSRLLLRTIRQRQAEAAKGAGKTK